MARLIGLAHAEDVRLEAGRFYLNHATVLCSNGDIIAAKAAIDYLAEIWPEGWAEALKAEALVPLWKLHTPPEFQGSAPADGW